MSFLAGVLVDHRDPTYSWKSMKANASKVMELADGGELCLWDAWISAAELDDYFDQFRHGLYSNSKTLN